LQNAFISTGALDGTVANVLNVGELVAFAYNFGTGSSSTGVNFAIGNYRAQSITFTAQTTNAPLSAYFTATYSTLDAAFKYFLNSYSTLHAASLTLDKQIRSAGEAISLHYADMGKFQDRRH